MMENIMEYFGKTAGGPGTGVVEGVKNELSHAHPNPFNPVTRIAYSVKEEGPVTIEVYNVAGRVVRTLLDAEVDAGASGYVVWDGTNDGGEKCASGVYFYRIAAPGFATSRKMVMLK
jgi:flagellar hook assembly protein FlgD